MKKVCIVVTDISRFGGTERAVTTLVNLLVDDFNVTIMSLYKSKEPDVQPRFYYNAKVQIKYFNIIEPAYTGKRFFKYIEIATVIRDYCTNNNIDITVGTSHAFNFLLPFIFFNKKIKTVATEHYARKALPISTKFLQRLSYPFLDALVILSESAKNNYSFINKKHIIPNSLSFETKIKSSLNNKVVLSVGRLSYEKGYDRLIELVYSIKDSLEGWIFKIYGSGDEKENLLSQIKLKGLDKIITIHDAIPNILPIYLSADIYIMTSYYEAFPMVLLEAKSCGLPVIAYDCPEGPRELINDGVDGFLVENNNIETMGAKLLELMNDFGLRQKMSSQATKNIQSFSSEVIQKKWLELLYNL